MRSVESVTYADTAPPPGRGLTDRPNAISGRFSRSMRRISARRVVAGTWLRPAACAEPLAPAPGPSGGSGGNGNHGSCGRWSAVLGCAASRGAKVVEDAADDAALGDEGDHPHHASAAGTDERIDLVHPANELGPSAAKGGQRGGRGVTRRRSVFARPWHERLCLLSLAAGLQLAAHDVRVGTVVVDEVAARIGDVGQQTGDEVEGIDGVGLLVVVAGLVGQVRGGG